jgi:hypothetical protein
MSLLQSDLTNAVVGFRKQANNLAAANSASEVVTSRVGRLCPDPNRCADQ